ncbi:Ubiquitin carboxyl-terminal hydrolase MINDY-1 [Physocladia obscura]|uniref:Ubiquitin carboxyl-terminal hydrolase MINDY-1 n=1 Tax=Physocladia obscura TaxID=109957 RepID=A0AAD5T2S2_9FUNG|nr:Ubiquitin carboxyl-terminal hydrolase MINDY-1 [Physocladia obscura]
MTDHNEHDTSTDFKLKEINIGRATQHIKSVPATAAPNISQVGPSLRILTQNSNGPCPLLALANVLLMRGDIIIKKDLASISFEALVEILGDYLIRKYSTETNAFENGKDNATVSKLSTNLMDAITLIPTLQKGLDVNVTFDSVFGFENTPSLSLFSAFGVTLCHGWVSNTSDFSFSESDVANSNFVEPIGIFGYPELRSYNHVVEAIVDAEVAAFEISKLNDSVIVDKTVTKLPDTDFQPVEISDVEPVVNTSELVSNTEKVSNTEPISDIGPVSNTEPISSAEPVSNMELVLNTEQIVEQTKSKDPVDPASTETNARISIESAHNIIPLENDSIIVDSNEANNTSSNNDDNDVENRDDSIFEKTDSTIPKTTDDDISREQISSAQQALAKTTHTPEATNEIETKDSSEFEPQTPTSQPSITFQLHIADTTHAVDDTAAAAVAVAVANKVAALEKRITLGKIANDFLSTTSTQLTPQGVAHLSANLQPASLAVLFRNNHFSVLHNHPQLGLFTLVTDEGYLTKTCVWESLSVDGDSVFVDAAFGAYLPTASDEAIDGVNLDGIDVEAQERAWKEIVDGASDGAVGSGGNGAGQSNGNMFDTDLALAMSLQDEENRLAAEEERPNQSFTPLVGQQPAQYNQQQQAQYNQQQQAQYNQQQQSQQYNGTFSSQRQQKKLQKKLSKGDEDSCSLQ